MTTTEQLDLFPEPVETLRLALTPGDKWSAEYARIELQMHTDGRWMWSASVYSFKCGWGYKVMPKWARFAKTCKQALEMAVDEMMERTTASRDFSAAHAVKVKAWVKRLKGAV